MELHDKVAVITGAGSGIGRGLARRLAGAGMKLVLSGCNIGPLEATASELAPFDTEIMCVPADVSQLAAVQALADAAIARFGEVHLLCNNAGVAVPGPLGEISMEDWRWVLSINLWGPIHGVQVFLPIMERQGVGHTVIRRRLQQKMEFVSDDLVSAGEPTETELVRYLTEHPDEFREEDSVTFRQVFLLRGHAIQY